MAIPTRYLVLVHLLLLGLAAYWGASTITTAIAVRLTPLPKVDLAPPPPPIAAPPAAAEQHYAIIRTRDLFNSAQPEAPKATPIPEPTQLKLKLLGVAVFHDSRPSWAAIEDQTSHKSEMYKDGAEVPGGAKIVRIEWDRVTLNRNGKEEYLDLEAPSGGPAPRSAIAGSGRSAPAAQAPGGGVEQVTENEYNIDRSEVDSALENMNQLFTQIRAVPHFEGGQSIGFRVFAIRQGSLFEKIGLKNGDIIRNINNVELTDPARAMSLFQELRNERSISLEITRNKEPRTISYQLR